MFGDEVYRSIKRGTPERSILDTCLNKVYHAFDSQLTPDSR